MLKLVGQRFQLAGLLWFLWARIRTGQKAPGSPAITPEGSSHIRSSDPVAAAARGGGGFYSRMMIYRTEARSQFGRRTGVTRHWVPADARFGPVIVGTLYALPQAFPGCVRSWMWLRGFSARSAPRVAVCADCDCSRSRSAKSQNLPRSAFAAASDL